MIELGSVYIVSHHNISFIASSVSRGSRREKFICQEGRITPGVYGRQYLSAKQAELFKGYTEGNTCMSSACLGILSSVFRANR